VSIQGVREDARAVKPLPPDKVRILWLCGSASGTLPFDKISSYENGDILADVNLMIQRLRAVGVQEAYAVDLTDPEIPASVARVVVPELESWFLTDFAPDSCRLGWRAGRYLGAAQPSREDFRGAAPPLVA
jgi:ribosomal protein S12 methylthiotransferase accessory factor